LRIEGNLVILWQWLQCLLETGQVTALTMRLLVYLILCPPDFAGIFKALGNAILGIVILVFAGILCFGSAIGLTVLSICSVGIGRLLSEHCQAA
jgi:hypothetical protein